MSNEKHIKNLFTYDEWNLIQEQLNTDNNDFLIAESLTSLGNGYFGSRGNFEETYTGKMHQGTYNAGVWFPDKTKVGWWKNGYPHYFGKAINSLNFLPIRVFVNDRELDLNVQIPFEFKRILDMKNGILSRQFKVKIDGVELSCQTERFYSISDPETAFIKYSVTPDKQCKIKFISVLDGNVWNQDSNHGEQFWNPIEAEIIDDKTQYNAIKTKANPFGVEQFSVANAALIDCQAETRTSSFDQFSTSLIYEKKVDSNQTFTIEKKVAILTTRHHEEKHLKKDVLKKLALLAKTTFDLEKTKHSELWNQRWQMCDIKIEGDPASQQGIRFSLFQLFSTFYGEDANFNIGPKGFTGEKYGGATYWDTEAYCIPTYLGVAPGYVTKSLLKYRHNQLPQAIENAKLLGLEGALFPMVTFNGVECHNEWEITFEEIHRNGAIAYAIYNYTNYTGDDSYLKNEGIDVLINISKFWASRVHLQKNKDVYMIHGVTGPNEFDNNVNNNWYTNLIAKWTLEYTLATIEKYKISAKKLKQWNVDENDFQKWNQIIKKMYLPEDQDLKIFVQHDGFLDKDFIETKDLKPEDRPIVHNWSWDKILRSCCIKQADVLQGIYLFEDQFSEDQIKNNYEFYEKYTVHESSLSPCIHSILAAKLNKMDDAFRFYKRSSRLDLDNYNDDTKDGLHITSMAGSWMTIVQGFAGMKIKDDKLSFSPKLPKEWQAYEFNLSFRDQIINVKVDQNGAQFGLVKGKKLTILVNGQEHLLS